jgi:hypothetical protein
MTDDPSRAEQQTRDRREEYELAEADDARTRALARIERARQEEVAADAAGYGELTEVATPER